MRALLDVNGVVKSFGGAPAVDGASLTVEENSITALIGPNGAGKTSLFNVVTGFEKADAGHVTYDGRRIDRLPAYRIARAGLVRTFQQPRVLRRLSVLENMLLTAPDQPAESFFRALAPGAGRADQALAEKALALLDLVRLADRAGEYAGMLSGGQRKLLEFSRALMAEPRLMLLDEPLAGVNPALRELMLERIQHLRSGKRITFLVIEHDLESVMRVSDTVAVMNLGRVIFTGPPRAAQRDPAVVDAYLGTADALAAAGASA